MERTQRDLVHSKFIIDRRYTSALKPQISDWFKKMKPLPGLSRIFQDYNKRYFTLNLLEITLYYSNKERSSLNDITYIPLEELQFISDKPHYALSNQGVEWKEAFGFTIYLNEKYIVLVAQSNETYSLWLNYLEAIRFRSNGKSILSRQRTPYYSNLLTLKLPEQQQIQIPSIEFKQQNTQSDSQKKDIDEQNNRQMDHIQQSQTSNNEYPANLQEVEQIRVDLQPQQVKKQENSINFFQNMIEQENKNLNRDENTFSDPYQNKDNKLIIYKDIQQKTVNMDFFEQETDQIIPQIDHFEENEQIIILNDTDQYPLQKENEKISYLPIPKRLDKIKKKPIFNSNQQSFKNTLIRNNNINIWDTQENYNKETINQDRTAMANDQTTQQANNFQLHISNVYDQIEFNQINWSDSLIKFDELDSSRWADSQ